ncbi:hypothetical protein P7K49_010337 [Saguinus oedipus]|uniref:Uncharacterized protein n=1 Tax=Saguinus oedipus TaxID=9490 RepID=A0ABQ9VMI3_SAGOE|nr:hypothetical protein P7K49_010337 [Saguinus oedipus]
MLTVSKGNSQRKSCQIWWVDAADCSAGRAAAPWRMLRLDRRSGGQGDWCPGGATQSRSPSRPRRLASAAGESGADPFPRDQRGRAGVAAARAAPKAGPRRRGARAAPSPANPPPPGLSLNGQRGEKKKEEEAAAAAAAGGRGEWEGGDPRSHIVRPPGPARSTLEEGADPRRLTGVLHRRLRRASSVLHSHPPAGEGEGEGREGEGREGRRGGGWRAGPGPGEGEGRGAGGLLSRSGSRAQARRSRFLSLAPERSPPFPSLSLDLRVTAPPLAHSLSRPPDSAAAPPLQLRLSQELPQRPDVTAPPPPPPPPPQTRQEAGGAGAGSGGGAAAHARGWAGPGAHRPAASLRASRAPHASCGASLGRRERQRGPATYRPSASGLRDNFPVCRGNEGGE